MKLEEAVNAAQIQRNESVTSSSAGDVNEIPKTNGGPGHPIVRRKSGMMGKKFPSLQVSFSQDV